MRLDIVWDTYIPDSLKESTREKRGKGVRRKVSGQTKLPSKWMDFLCDSKNKEELFVFLTNKVAEATFPPDSLVYVTTGESVLQTGSRNHMPDCNHEDTRIVVHVLHALQQGMRKIKICTVDTDVIIILMGAFHKLVKTQPVADIWVAFGVGKSYRFLSINAIFDSLGKQKAQALPLFHALTGSDTTSAFKGKGKKSAWQAWQAFAEVTDTFIYLSLHPFKSLSV